MDPLEFRRLFLEITKSNPKGWWWSHGGCFEYAYCFIKVLGGVGESYLTNRKQYRAYGHCFIKYQGLYFDSENPEGLDSWKKLQPYMTRAQNKKKTTHQGLSGLCRRWGITPEKAKVLDEIVEKINRKNEREYIKPSLRSRSYEWIIP